MSRTYKRTHSLTFVFVFLLAVSFVYIVLAPASAYAVDQAGTQQTKESTTALQTKAPTTYKVVFKANGGKGTMKSQVIKRGKKTALKANKFKRSGYKFVGWSTKKNGKGKTYKNKAKVKNLAKAGKTIKLYAQWKKYKSVTIKNEAFKLTLPSYWKGRVKVKRYNSDDWFHVLYITDKKGTILVWFLFKPKKEITRDMDYIGTFHDDDKFIGSREGKKYRVYVKTSAWYTVDWAFSSGDPSILGVQGDMKTVNNYSDLLTGGKIKNRTQYFAAGGQTGIYSGHFAGEYIAGKYIEKYLKANIVKKIKVN